MTADLHDFVLVIGAWAATYVVHSTFLLATAWLVLKVCRVKSHALAEQLWKTSAVLGLATASLQMGVQGPASVWELRMGTAVKLLDAEPSSNSIVAGDASPPSTAVRTAVGLGSTTEPPATQPAAGVVEFDRRPLKPTAGLGAAGQHRQPISQTDESQHPANGIPSNKHSRRSLPKSAGPLNAIDRPQKPALHADRARNERVAAVDYRHSVEHVALLAPGSLAVVCLVVGVALLFVQSLAFRRRLAGGRSINSGPARRTLDRFLQRNGINRRVRLLISETAGEPVAFGLWRWTIVLPADTDKCVDGRELQAVLAHELAHLVRGDVWWLWIGRLLCACAAFQPLNHLARRRWQQAAEFLCDDWAVAHGVSATALARCLTRIAEWRLDGPPCVAALTAAGSKHVLVQRVERLLEKPCRPDVWSKPWSRRLAATTALASALLLACLLPRVSVGTGIAIDRQPTGRGTADPAGGNSRSRFGNGATQPISTATHITDGRFGDEWQLLEAELARLDKELGRVHTLLAQIALTPEMRHAGEQLRHRAAWLRQRRRAIAVSLQKE